MTEDGWHPVPYRMRNALLRRSLKGGLLSEGVLCEGFVISGIPVDPVRLDCALRRTVIRHPALRTRFRVDDDLATAQRIGEVWPEILSVVPVAGSDLEARALSYVSEHGRARFDLTKGRQLRATLFTDGARDHVLVISVDHTCCDGVSFRRVIADISAAYNDPQMSAREYTEPPYTLVEYAYDEAAFLSGPGGDQARQDWRARLGGRIPELVLEDERPWEELKADGPLISAELSGERYAQFWKTAAGMAVTPYMLAVAMMLSAMRDSIRGDTWSFIAPLAGRLPGTPASLVGNLVSPAPVAVRRDDTAQLPAVAAAVREGILWALAHQALPAEEIIATLDPDGPQLIQQRRQIFISGEHRGALKLDGHSARPLKAEISGASALFDLSLWVSTTDFGLSLTTIHRDCLLPAETVRGWLEQIHA